MKKLLSIVLAVCAFSAFADRTAKAVFNSETLKLEFYYDELDHSGDNVTVYLIAEAGSKTWGDATTATQAVFDVSFKDFKSKSHASWFYGFNCIKEFIGFENVDTSNSTSFNGMFRYVPAVEMDLSRFDWQKITNIGSMLNSCTELTTVYVAPDFALRSDISTDSPFTYNYGLTGGAGSKWSKSASDISYARIDGGESAPGYFTEKVVELPPAIYSVSQSHCTESSVIVSIAGRFWQKTGTLTVELKTGGVTAKSQVLSAYGDVEFTGLESSTEYQVIVSADNDYGTTTDDTLTVTTLDDPSIRWFYDESAGMISNAVWSFGASIVTKNTTDLSVDKVQSYPEVTSELNLSRQVVDAKGVVYNIVNTQGCFGENTKASGWKSVGLSPQCARVGLLTLPKKLKKILDNSFTYCTNMTIACGIPGTVSAIGNGAFKGAKMPDEIVITNVSTIGNAAFEESSVKSVVFGPALTLIDGNYDKGAFQRCYQLTNVTFDVNSSWCAPYCTTFSQCTSLTELNLWGMTNAACATSIAGGAGVVRMVFDSRLHDVNAILFKNADSLTTVVFEGIPPVSMETPLYAQLSNTKTITTYVPYKLLAVSNSADKCWLDYAAGGKIEKRDTTWASDYTGSADVSKRPLLTIPPSGLMLLVR